MTGLKDALAVLAALGVEEITYTLDGSGDSGDVTLDEVRYADGREDMDLPEQAIGFDDSGRVQMLDEVLEDLVAAQPDGNWWDGPGGHGTVVLRPLAPKGERVHCSMRYHEESSEECNGDPEEFDDDDGDEAADENEGAPA